MGKLGNCIMNKWERGKRGEKGRGRKFIDKGKGIKK